MLQEGFDRFEKQVLHIILDNFHRMAPIGVRASLLDASGMLPEINEG